MFYIFYYSTFHNLYELKIYSYILNKKSNSLKIIIMIYKCLIPYKCFQKNPKGCLFSTNKILFRLTILIFCVTINDYVIFDY